MRHFLISVPRQGFTGNGSNDLRCLPEMFKQQVFLHEICMS